MKKYKENTNRNPAFSLKWKIGRLYFSFFFPSFLQIIHFFFFLGLEEGWISQFKNNLGEIEPLAQDCKVYLLFFFVLDGYLSFKKRNIDLIFFFF